jgi:hypothetical protein
MGLGIAYGLRLTVTDQIDQCLSGIYIFATLGRRPHYEAVPAYTGQLQECIFRLPTVGDGPNEIK